MIGVFGFDYSDDSQFLRNRVSVHNPPGGGPIRLLAGGHSFYTRICNMDVIEKGYSWLPGRVLGVRVNSKVSEKY